MSQFWWTIGFVSILWNVICTQWQGTRSWIVPNSRWHGEWGFACKTDFFSFQWLGWRISNRYTVQRNRSTLILLFKQSEYSILTTGHSLQDDRFNYSLNFEWAGFDLHLQKFCDNNVVWSLIASPAHTKCSWVMVILVPKSKLHSYIKCNRLFNSVRVW